MTLVVASGAHFPMALRRVRSLRLHLVPITPLTRVTLSTPGLGWRGRRPQHRGTSVFDLAYYTRV